jgi:hypothetical protein
MPVSQRFLHILEQVARLGIPSLVWSILRHAKVEAHPHIAQKVGVMLICAIATRLI